MIFKEDQKMSCPEGQYFCNEKQKCMPIPKGNKVRKDGELVSEVAPPGYGHTKGDKEKGVKKGGTAAAFKRALDDGRFKGLPGDKTKKEKTASMFKLMWSMKKKGDKPHYKPGTDKKYKKYQEEVAMPHVSTKDKKAMAKRAKNLFTKDEVGTKQGVNEKTTMKDNNLFGDAYAGSYEKLKKKIGSKKMHNKPAIEENKFVKAMVDAVKKRKEEKKPEKAMDAGARAKRQLARKVHAKYVSGSTENVPDDIRDHKTWNDFKKHIN